MFQIVEQPRSIHSGFSFLDQRDSARYGSPEQCSRFMPRQPRRFMRRKCCGKAAPIERLALLLVNGQQNFERILVRLHFESGLFER